MKIERECWCKFWLSFNLLSAGETSAPRLATAQRAAAWQKRRPPPPPSAPATPSAADADAAAADAAADGLQSAPSGNENVSLQGCPSVAEVAAAEARAWAAAMSEASPEELLPQAPAAAMAKTTGSGHAAGAVDLANADDTVTAAAAAKSPATDAVHVIAADSDAYLSDTPMAHASSLSTPANGFVAYLPLASTQPDRQPSGTWPRGILKSGGSSVDSLKGKSSTWPHFFAPC